MPTCARCGQWEPKRESSCTRCGGDLTGVTVAARRSSTYENESLLANVPGTIVWTVILVGIPLAFAAAAALPVVWLWTVLVPARPIHLGHVAAAVASTLAVVAAVTSLGPSYPDVARVIGAKRVSQNVWRAFSDASTVVIGIAWNVLLLNWVAPA